MNNKNGRTYKLSLLILVLTSFHFSTVYSQIICPSTTSNQLVIGTINVGLNSLTTIPLNTSSDVKCYNHTLVRSFTAQPSVATAISDLNSQYSQYLFLTIKPIRNPNNDYSYISFLVRTQWRYTSWNSIKFNYIAERRTDLETGIYQIETGYLGGCSVGKDILVYLPLHTSFVSSPSVLIFLSGFQISTLQSSANPNNYSPFQVQQQIMSKNLTGVTIFVSTTSSTQINDLLISYVAFDSRLESKFVYSNYLYDQYITRQSLTTSIMITSNVNALGAIFHGLGGFIISHSQFSSVQFGVSYDSNNRNFTFSSSNGIQYLGYSYLALRDDCVLCDGYSLLYNNQCYSSCPSNTYQMGGICVACAAGQIWNGNSCVTQCTGGRFWNSTINSCQCNAGTNWNGLSCIQCTGGRIWSPFSLTCGCPTGSNWNNSACVQCSGNRSWNQFSLSCECPSNTNWNGNTCMTCTDGFWNATVLSCQCNSNAYWNGNACVTCSGGRFWNATISSCQCQIGTTWNGLTCQGCTGGRFYNTTVASCQCPSPTVWNGASCIQQCINGQQWNPVTTSCQCTPGTYYTGTACVTCSAGRYWNATLSSCMCYSSTYWNGVECVSCTGGRVWNSAVNSCQCLAPLTWNGVVCIQINSCSGGRVWSTALNSCQCPSNTNWNGQNCVTCSNGQIWNSAFNTCQCSSNTNWNGQSCITCSNGQVWNAGLNICQCPSPLTWNGIACIQINTCSGGRVWNTALNSCQCPTNYNWNGQTCLMCTSGQVWNSNINSCQCPSPLTWNGQSCIQINTCSGGRTWNSTTNACQCPFNTYWNNSACQQCYDGSYWNPNTLQCNCNSPKIYSQSRCICPTGYTIQSNGQCQLIPTCQPGTVYNGYECVSSCLPGYYYNGTACTRFIPTCPDGTFWNGINCQVSVSSCPTGMTWNGSLCVSNNPSCQNGNFYWNGVSCVPISERCPYQLIWLNNMCLPTTNQCPSGTYYNGYQCVRYVGCDNNLVWNNTLCQCLCPSNAFWNGLSCVSCTGGRIYDAADGCVCPSGMFFNGTACQQNGQQFCSTVDHATWNSTHCVCLPGYTAVSGQCVCYGLEMISNGGWCNRCSQKPNSFYSNGICVCLSGYFENGNDQCVNTTIVTNPTSPSICNVGNYFDNQAKQCLRCVQGCLSCVDCYQCFQCQVGYLYNPLSGMCNQICGDGRRFSLSCDDGNNNNGDGCSMDCKVEAGYSCQGGSPDARDQCARFNPQQVTLTQTGQSHLYGKIVMNVRLNYLPKQLIESEPDCKSTCSKVLRAQVVAGDMSSTSIITNYIGGAYHGFSVEIIYNKEPIGAFTIRFSINSALKSKYFSTVNISNSLSVEVTPAYLSLVQDQDFLTFDMLNP